MQIFENLINMFYSIGVSIKNDKNVDKMLYKHFEK